MTTETERADYEKWAYEIENFATRIDRLYQGEFDPALFAAWQAGRASIPAGEPIAWGIQSKYGSIVDCISRRSHDQFEGHYTVPLYTAPVAPKEMPGHVVVTKNESGQIVAVTRQDSEGRVVSVIAESASGVAPTAEPKENDRG